MSIEEGEIELYLKNPLSSERILVKNLDKYLKDENNILIYLDDDPMPYCMKRSYFINLLIEDFDYKCTSSNIVAISTSTTKYYNLSKLFLNVEGQPKIVVKMSDITAFFDPSITHYKLTSIETHEVQTRSTKAYSTSSRSRKARSTKTRTRKMRPRKLILNTCTNVDIRKHNYDESVYRDGKYPYEEEKWTAFSIYCSSGYEKINRYLVRLTDMPKYELSELFEDMVHWLKGSKKKIPDPIKTNKRIQDAIDDIDHLFHKYAEKNDKPMVVWRNMNTFYTYLKNPGDKMVVENYMSCFDEGGGVHGFWNVYCTITVDPGIPYIKTYKNKEFRPFLQHPEEKEVVLPRNLIATYEGEDADGNKLIRMSPLYPGQFSDKLVCNKMNVYKIEKGVDVSSSRGVFDWKEIHGG